MNHRFAHEPLRFKPRGGYYLAGDGVIRLPRDEANVDPQLEPEETERWVLTRPPPPVGAEEPMLLWPWVLIIVGAIILMVI